MELDLAILGFMKSCASSVDEMVRLLQAEYRIRFGRPLLLDSRQEGSNPIELVWALERSIEEGDPNRVASILRQRQQQGSSTDKVSGA